VPGIGADQVPQLVERYRFHYLSQDEQLVLFEGASRLLKNAPIQRSKHVEKYS
jgi:phosphoglycolate phosphatase